MADYEIVENSSEDDYKSSPMPVRSSVRDALASIDAQRSAMKAQKDFGFDEASFGYNNNEGKEVETYGLREQREENL